MVIVRLGRLGVVHQSPSLCRCIYSGKGWEVLVCCVRPPRCSIPVPQPLSVMNSVKAWNINRFVGGGGVANVRGLLRVQ